MKKMSMLKKNNDKAELSYSRIATWKRCWKKYHYRYVDGLRLKRAPKKPRMGRLAHEGLKAKWDGEDWEEHIKEEIGMPESLIPDEDLKDLQLVIDVLHRYFEHRGCFRCPDEVDLIEPETRFSVPIPGTGSNLMGYMDKVIKVPGEGVWLIDHKFTTLSPEKKLEKLELNEQIDYYIWALTQMFPDEIIIGAMFNVVRLKLPAKPEPIKSGKRLSKAKITTDYQTYYNAILEHDFDPKDYQKMLMKLEHQKSPFFQRGWIDRDDFEITQIGRELQQVAFEIPKTSNDIRTRNTGQCSWDCDYKDLCLTEKKGGDIEAIVDEYFEYSDWVEDDESESEGNESEELPF